MTYHYIDSNQALSDFCLRIRNDRYCALDTEFIREKTYYPVLALIQLATESAQACIDPLAIDDFTPLVELFHNRSMLKILHAPGQDLELFYHRFAVLPVPIFDTQLAAAVLGYANQIGYADLVNRLCRVQLEKKYTRANWSRRPLSEGELDYAMDDVRYLIDIYQQLNTDLQQRGRLDWIQDDLETLSEPATYQVNSADLWKRLKGVQKLKGAGLNNADQLCRWREQVAIDKNRPRRWIMKDEDIIDIARFRPRSAAELAQIGSLSSEYIRKNGEAILLILDQAEQIDPSEYPRHQAVTKLSNQQQAVSDCLMAISRDVTEENEIALASVATKKDIDLMVIGQNATKLLSGWRYQMLGKVLQSFLEGEISVSVENGRLKY